MPGRPECSEYPPALARYVALVPDGDARAHLAAQGRATRDALRRLPEGSGAARYAPGKWSVAEVCGHMADTERVMAARMLWALRGGGGTLPGFDQDAFVAAARGSRPLAAVVEDLGAVRAATLALADGAPDDAWLRRCRVDEEAVSARALLYVIAGHELHHRAVLRDRYALSMP